MNSIVENILREILDNQRKTSRLVHFLAHRLARELIIDNLTKSLERRVYELSDGIRSSRDIERMISKKVTQRTIVTWWRKWRELGIVEESPAYSGRVRKIISLDDLGIDLQTGDSTDENPQDEDE
ncbi:MAG: hypothetical protein P9L92_08570 [Candidatus Electryonea clarkiae]|nr:hypothetical protein [Candidatus Electryonea clarkiae]MDP8285924.1 hypothetical protein [Candidatus Electryonea clarkiae]